MVIMMGAAFLEQELHEKTAPHFTNAEKFYQGMAARLVKHGHVLDSFSCALDQARSPPPRPEPDPKSEPEP